MSEESKLTSMTVSLLRDQKAYVKAQAEATGCSTPSEYIRRLIHADQVEREQAELERRILASLDSPPLPMGKEEWRALRQTLREKLLQQSKRP